jgi:hypothetical protein
MIRRMGGRLLAARRPDDGRRRHERAAERRPRDHCFLEDAAGNRTTLFGPTPMIVDNSRGALNATNGGDGAVLTRRGRARRTSSFGGRRIVLRGALARGGQTVTGAVLDVLAQNDVPGGRLHKIGEAHTNVRGHFAIRVKGGPSRLLRVAYKADSADSAPAASSECASACMPASGSECGAARCPPVAPDASRGRSTAASSRATASSSSCRRFDGGAWRTFDSVRTNRSGRYAAPVSPHAAGADVPLPRPRARGARIPVPARRQPDGPPAGGVMRRTVTGTRPSCIRSTSPACARATAADVTGAPSPSSTSA